jgi:hypothetical protein
MVVGDWSDERFRILQYPGHVPLRTGFVLFFWNAVLVTVGPSRYGIKGTYHFDEVRYPYNLTAPFADKGNSPAILCARATHFPGLSTFQDQRDPWLIYDESFQDNPLYV